MAKMKINVLKFINPRISCSSTPILSIETTAIAPIINAIGK
jgi:hypothetical protein